MVRKEYYVFDIDGTITPPRKPMEPDFSPRFFSFCSNHSVILVSGSSIDMIKEQIPKDILDLVKVYGCSGIEGCYVDVDYEIDDYPLESYLNHLVEYYTYPNKTGNHIEKRKGMINFSIVGRNATQKDRMEYAEFDSRFNQRKRIVEKLKQQFGDTYDICIGGEISIDITKKGINKSIVAKDILTFDKNPYIIFYGNQILDGNDYYLAKSIQENRIGHSIQIDYENLKKFI